MMKKICKNCSCDFEIPKDDLEFYKTISPEIAGKKYFIHPPTLCIQCRKQRRYSWRNEFNYYKRNCDKCQKDIISVYDPEGKYKVYCCDCYLNRDWDPLFYGQSYDFNRDFFEQFNELLIKVPRITMVNDSGNGSENCEYTFNFVYGKNCYLVTTSWYAENCLYVSKSGKLLDVIDCDNVSESELLHECVSSNHLYNCQYLESSQNCNNCMFGRDLRSCADCFCCVGLVNKNYHIFNKPYSPEEYKKIISIAKLDTLDGIKKFKSEFKKFLEKFPYKASSLLNCEDCSGDRLANSRNTIGFGIWNAENIKYMDFGDTPKNSQDLLVAGLCEWCYESQVPDHSYQTCFTNYCWSCIDVFYSDDCRYCKNLFGCIGLRNAEYCIFNKQYSKEEYENLVPKIIQHMGNHFGEFFPSKMSFFGYNETIAQDYLPLIEKTDRFNWKNKSNVINTSKNSNKIPDKKINEIAVSDIMNPFSCNSCDKLYKIPQQELILRQKFNAPLPDCCPSCRRLERSKLMNPTKIYQRACSNCNKVTSSRYNTDVESVFCHECYINFDFTKN